MARCSQNPLRSGLRKHPNHLIATGHHRSEVSRRKANQWPEKAHPSRHWGPQHAIGEEPAETVPQGGSWLRSRSLRTKPATRSHETSRIEGHLHPSSANHSTATSRALHSHAVSNTAPHHIEEPNRQARYVLPQYICAQAYHRLEDTLENCPMS